ncbi:MAG: hypothetical protein ACOCXH_02025 [Cyclobacteriaceae bacterium]
MNSIIKSIINHPVENVPAWTVALFDPTTGDLPRRELDEQKTKDYMQAIAQAGAPGVLLAASTGWGHARDFAEHRHTLAVAGEVPLNNCIKQALIRIEDPLEDNINLINDLKSWEYGMVWTRRGSDLPIGASDEIVTEHMLPLVKASIAAEMPIGLYSISTVDGAPLTASAAKMLLNKLSPAEAQFLVAIKITEPVFENSTLDYLQEPAFDHKKIVQGWDAFYAEALQQGLRPNGHNHCGATSGAAACMVYAYKAMYETTLKNDWDKLAEIQSVVSRVFLSMQGDDKNKFPDLQIAKWVMGLGHPLTEERSEKDAANLVKTLHQLSEDEDSIPTLRLILQSFLLMEPCGYHSPIKNELSTIIAKIA